MKDLESGLQAWRQMSNHNRMIALQDGGADEASPADAGDVEIAFFGSSSFRVTTPHECIDAGSAGRHEAELRGDEEGVRRHEDDHGGNPPEQGRNRYCFHNG